MPKGTIRGTTAAAARITGVVQFRPGYSVGVEPKGPSDVTVDGKVVDVDGVDAVDAVADAADEVGAVDAAAPAPPAAPAAPAAAASAAPAAPAAPAHPAAPATPAAPAAAPRWACGAPPFAACPSRSDLASMNAWTPRTNLPS